MLEQSRRGKVRFMFRQHAASPIRPDWGGFATRYRSNEPLHGIVWEISQNCPSPPRAAGRAPGARESARRPVSRVLSPPIVGGGWPFIWDARYRTPRATNPGDGAETPLEPVVKPAPCRPYSVLLPVGFTVPPPLPAVRCALTAPFHPYPPSGDRSERAVCFLWHFPWGRPRRPLTGTVFPWSPDFPPPAACAVKGGHPAVWREAP